MEQLITILAIVFVVILLLSFLIFTYYKFRLFRKNHIKSLSVNLERNYDVLVLGDSKIVPEQDATCAVYTNYYRNIHTDRLVLERYYSLVRTGGIIRLYIDKLDRKYLAGKCISPFDFQYLHPVTLFEERVPENWNNKAKLFIDLFRFAFVGFGYCFHKRNFKLANNAELENLAEQIPDVSKMIKLCDKKTLIFELYISN